MKSSIAVRGLVVWCCAIAVTLGVLPVRAGMQDQPGMVTELLNQAFREYKETDLRKPEATCDRVILILLAVPDLSDVQTQQLLTAFELRGRTRFLLKDETRAREDFRAILMRAPTHQFGSLTIERAGSLNQKTSDFFEGVRKDVVGSVVFNISPDDADVMFRGAPLPFERRSGGRQLMVPVGTHRLVVQHRMFEPQDLQVQIEPGAPNTVKVVLTRTSSQVDIITSAPGVEVILGKDSRGMTVEQLPEKYAKLPEVVGLGPAPGLRTMLDVPTGTWQVELRKPCFQTDSFELKITEPGVSYIVRPLKKSSALLEIKGTSGTVWIDGQQEKQPVPYSGELCQKTDPRVVEIRSARGRQVLRFDPIPGQKIEFVADPKPAIAILAQTGLPAGFQENLKETVEKALLQAGIEAATFFSVPADVAQNEMKLAEVKAGWLARDVDGRLLSPEADLMSEAIWRNAASAISTHLDVQGVAEIHVPAFNRDRRSLLLTFLASGSGVPETIPINLDEPRSLQAAVSYVNNRFRMTKVGSGLAVADVEGVSGAVVLNQAWKTTGDVLVAGDVIVAADGSKVTSASMFEDLVASKKPKQTIALQVQRKGTPGSPTAVQLTTEEFSQVVAFMDQTLPLNKRLLEFRLAVQDAPPGRQAIPRLNLAIVLMRVGNWSLAKAELDKIGPNELPDGAGIAKGTLQYYLGLCLDSLGRPDEADQAYRMAAASQAWLTADGPAIKPLAEQRLADKSRKGR